jgi:hypothetical protein
MRLDESGGVPRVDVLNGSPSTRTTPIRHRTAMSRASVLTAVSPAEARAIAKEAHIYGFPMVESYRVQHAYFVDRCHPDFKAPWNHIVHDPRVSAPADAFVPRPVPDTSYSYLGADLRAEPLVLTFPAVERGRYFSAQFVDMYTFNFAYVGSRTSGQSGGRFLLAGPRWIGVKPAGMTAAICCETDFAFLRYRTQLFAPDDIDNVKVIQAGYTVQPLSAYLGKPPHAQPPVDFVWPLKPSLACTSLNFFHVLNFLLRFCPPHPSELPLMARFAAIGLGAGRTFDVNALSPEIRRAMEDGMVDAWLANTEVAKEVATGMLAPDDLHGTRSSMRRAYIYRMVAALDSLYGDSREEVRSWITYVDSTGAKIDTTRGRYRLRFEPGQLPPVDAFWSLTLYELPSQCLFANARNRHLINSTMLPGLRRDADGGVTIDIQHESPGALRDANWLPAPKGRVVLALRLYAPKLAAQHFWREPTLQRAE